MIFLMTLYTLLIAIFASWLYFIRDCKDTNIPGPRPLPIVGNGLMFLGPATSFLPLLERLKNSFGNAVRVHLLSKRYVVLYHPQYVEQVVSRSDLITKGRSYTFLLPWLGDGLLTSTGNKWKTHRKFLTPAFHFTILQNFLPVFQKNEKILVQKLKRLADGSPVNMFPIIALNALDNITESIMGVSINAQKDSESEYVKAITAISEIVALRMRNPFVAENFIFNMTSLRKVQENAIKVLHGQTNHVIEKRRKELENLNITSLAEETEIGIRNKHAFLDLLLLAETNGKRVSDENIREEVDTFMFEGHDTTTSGICFSLYLLAKNPDVQEKILQEQKDILGDLGRDPTYSELQKMRYLELVIKECLRIYPSVPLIERLITKDTEIAGLKVKRDTSILIDIFHMHRNPELFEDPLEFRPERFDTNQNMKNAFSWIAFSAGPRNCIGQKFAMLELKTILAGVVKNFIVMPTEEEPQLRADLILRSENGVNLKFKAR